MRIFEVRGHDQRVLRIAVVGTCRVLNPFEDLAQLGKLKRIWANYPAATYSLGEAIQIIRYTLQDQDIPTELLQFIFDEPQKLPARDRQQPELLRSCDAFVIEVPELRQFKHTQAYFQVNVFFRSFLGKYQNAIAPWYREFSLQREISDDLVSVTLDALSHLSDSEREIVKSVLQYTRLEKLSAATIISGIPKLKLNETAHVIVVSHFVVPGLDGTSMRDRLAIREVLREGTAQCGVDFFDPSELVARYGRTTALSSQGADIHHYNPEFQHTIAEALLDRIQKHA